MYNAYPSGFVALPVQQPVLIPCMGAWATNALVPVRSVSSDDSPGAAAAACPESKGRSSRARRARRNRRALRQGFAAAGQEPAPADPGAHHQGAGTPAQARPDAGGDSGDAEGQGSSGEQEDVVGGGEPGDLAESAGRSCEILSRLEDADHAEVQEVVDWLRGHVLALALSKHGCRVVQKALEVADCTARDELFAELEPHVVELYDSPHGNHVLTKVVEILPTAALRTVIGQLQARGPAAVARHRFGCRVLERLIEHCSEAEIGELVDQIVAQSEMLCRHTYGNFVVQHLLEQGSLARRRGILNQLIPVLPYLAMHRTASHVVQRAIAYSDLESLHQLVNALLYGQTPHSFLEVACSHYGSFVLYQLTDLRARSPLHFGVVHQALATNVDALVQTDYGRRVAEHFGLEVPSPSSPRGAEAAGALA